MAIQGFVIPVRAIFDGKIQLEVLREMLKES